MNKELKEIIEELKGIVGYLEDAKALSTHSKIRQSIPDKIKEVLEIAKTELIDYQDSLIIDLQVSKNFKGGKK